MSLFSLAALAGMVAPAYTFAKDLLVYSKKKQKFVEKIGENLDKLRQKVEHLVAVIKDREVDAERYVSTKEWTFVGKIVVGQAKKFVVEFNEIEAKYERKKSQKCNFFTLAKLSKEIKIDRMTEVAELIEKLERNDLFTNKLPEPFDIIDAEDISDLPSLDEKVNELLQCLREEDVKTVAIYGRPGIGITAVLKNVHYILKCFHDESTESNQSLFDMAFFVTIGTEKNAISKIQKEIAKKFEISVGDDKKAASIISKALEKRKYLLLLDEVHSPVDLAAVGITDKHKHGKVVIAATNKRVLKEMKLDHDILVPSLSAENAWNLFRRYVGDVVEVDHIKYAAERIVSQLGGLPLIIKTMGLHMKDVKDQYVWNCKLAAMQESYINSDDHQLQGLGGVRSVYEFVYNELPSDRKKCLLYGALFPQDSYISTYYLIETWRAERFLQRPCLPRDYQLYREARDKGYQILQDLTETCMLDEYDTMEQVKMPILFRKMALKLPYPEEEDHGKVLVRAGEGIKENPMEEEWSDAKRVSLMCNELRCLTNSPKCLKISTLLLQCNQSLKTIEESFFRHMRELRVLDLSHTGIKCLPLYVCSLSNLKGLYLTGCNGLSRIPAEIKGLQSLEVLDICGTSIQYLPIEIQSLVCLKCLRFSLTRILESTNNGVDNSGVVESNGIQWFFRRQRETQKKIVPRNLVEKLCMLEELTIKVDNMDQRWSAIADGIAKEVASLRALTTLCFNFPNINSLETFVKESRPWKKQNASQGPFFRSFNFQIGYHERLHSYGSYLCQNSHERCLKLSTGDATASAVRDVLKQANTFVLIGHETIGYLSDFGMECVKNLEVCVIEACHKMVSIIDDKGGVAFPRLQKLHIINLQLLQCIHKETVAAESFSKLTSLTLKGCPMLRKILTPGISHALVQLQHLRVENCRNISSIIKVNIGEITSEEDNLSLLGALPELKILELVNLPALVSICQNTSLDWLSLVRIEMRACGMLRRLPLTATNAQKLRLIKCNEDWWRALDMERPLMDRLNLLCCFISEEEPSDCETPPETPAGNDGGEPHDHLPDLSPISNHHLNSQ